MDPFKERVMQIYQHLEQYNYYELLNLTIDASPDQIRTSFHRMALSLHPDQFSQNPDTELKSVVYTIYKRITEAYRVLMDAKDRREYNAGLDAGTLRLLRTERKVTGPRNQALAITNPQAKRFFSMAEDAERRGDLKGAKMNFKFALDMAPDNPQILERLNAVDAKLANR